MEKFIVRHILEEDVQLISSFTVKRKEGKGLERYLKKYALNEEKEGSRTYLVIDNETKELAGYFTLRTGLITIKRPFPFGIFGTFDTKTGVEMTNFAVNDAYKDKHKAELKGIRLGEYFFYKFVHPLVKEVSNIVGCEYLYIFALPEDTLISYYTDVLKFGRLDKNLEKFVHRHVRPGYDAGCIFMAQKL